MPNLEPKASIFDIVLSLSSAIDLVDPLFKNHHKRVAYISYSIAKEMNLPDKQVKDLMLAALLHDCGSVSLSEWRSLLDFGFGRSIYQRHAHGYKGWRILHHTNELQTAAEIIKFHHIYWDERSGTHLLSYDIPLESYILHLADRVDSLINNDMDILTQRIYIQDIINQNSGTMFMPKVVEAFNNLFSRQYFWFDIISPYLDFIIKKAITPFNFNIDNSNLHQYAEITHRLIDLKSAFTAAHSINVATCASILASKLGFNNSDIETMYSAGLIHDIGMLSVPEEILEKPDTLDLTEYNIIKYHTYHTYRLLEAIPGLEKVKDWASFHHEKLDGSGYPFGLKSDQLDLGSRIIAVSDLFTSLTENRSYRPALSLNMAMEIINNTNNLDYDVIACLNKNVEEIIEKINTSKSIVCNV